MEWGAGARGGQDVSDRFQILWCGMQVYPEGRMSQTMDKLKIGDKLEFRGPRGRFALDLNERRALGELPLHPNCRHHLESRP